MYYVDAMKGLKARIKICPQLYGSFPQRYCNEMKGLDLRKKKIEERPKI